MSVLGRSLLLHATSVLGRTLLLDATCLEVTPV